MKFEKINCPEPPNAAPESFWTVGPETLFTRMPTPVSASSHCQAERWAESVSGAASRTRTTAVAARVTACPR